MLRCNRINEYEAALLSDEEKVDLIKHIDTCVKCQRSIKRNSVSVYGMQMAIINDIESKVDNITETPEFEAEQKAIFQQLKQKTKLIEEDYLRRKRAEKKTLNLFPFKNFKLSFSFAAILIICFSIPLFLRLKNTDVSGISGPKIKSVPQQMIDISLILRKRDGTAVFNNDTLKIGEKIWFEYKNLSKSYVTILYLKDEKTTIIQEETLKQSGTYNLEKLSWEFEIKGEHYFIAIASESPFTRINEIKSPEDLKSTRNIAFFVKKIIIE